MLKKLFLHNYRNHSDLLFSFAPGVNQVIGPNGSGKSSLLEAVSLLSLGKSFREIPFCEQQQIGKDSFSIQAALESSEGAESKIKLFWSQEKKDLWIDEIHSSVFSTLLGHLPSVFLSPQDLELIQGAPEDRRRFLNMHLCQMDREYAYHLSRYQKALRCRNLLLKEKASTSLLLPWETQLALSAAFIGKKRHAFIQDLQEPLLQLGQTLSDQSDRFTLTIKHSIPLDFSLSQELIGEKIIDFYEQTRQEDLLAQITGFGPQKDDLHLLYNDRLAKSIASEGQKRTLTVALKLAVSKLMRQGDRVPLVCIDDLFTHLDEKRQKLLFEELSFFPQIIITMPTILSRSPFKGDPILLSSN